MQDYWEEIFAAPWWEIRTVQELNDVFVEEGLLFEPGAEFHYSNSGPVVLGLIIEAISGQDYYDYIREHIYEPAGMANSGCFEVDRPVPNLAIGYTLTNYDGERGDDGWRNNLFMHPAKGGPAGGGYSTVEDLLSFAKALTSHQLLNEQYTEILTAGKVEMGGPDSKYAYLFGDRVEDGQRSIGHNGGAPGISAALRIYVDSGYTVAVMSNYDMMADRIAGKIHQLLVHE
jgi:CubicO group peptidase (beta-lactamase class C family)